MLPRSLVLPARVLIATSIVLMARSRMWAGVHRPSDPYSMGEQASAVIVDELAEVAAAGVFD